MSANETVGINFQANGADKFAQDVEKGAGALDKQTEALDKHSDALDKDKQVIKTTETEVNKLTDASNKNEIALRKQLNAIEAQRLALQKEVDALKASNVVNQDRLNALQRQIQQDKFAEASLRAKIQAMKDEAKAAKEASGYIQQSANDIGTSIRNALSITALIGTVAAALVGLDEAVKQYGQFERTLNTIKAVSSATAEELQSIKESSLDLGAKTVFTNQQVADSYLNLSKAGLTAKESLAAMPGVLDAAAASGEGLEETSATVIGTLRGFGLQANETARVADVLAQAANTSSADIGDIGEAMKQLAPVASQANQSLEDMGAVTAALADRMIKGSDAGSDLKAILLRLVSPPAEAAKAIKTLGLSVTDAQGRVKPLIDIILQLQTKLKSFNQKSQLTFLGDIAGLENVKSLSVLLGIGADKLKAYQAAMLDANGAAKRMADTINKGVNTAFEQFEGSAQSAATSVGAGLAPAVINILNRLTLLLNLISENSKGFSDFVEQTVRLAGQLLILTGPIGSVINSFKDLTDKLSQGSDIGYKFGNILKTIAGTFDFVSTSAEKADIFMRRTLETFQNVINSVGHTSAFSKMQEATDAKYDKELNSVNQAASERDASRNAIPLLTPLPLKPRINPPSPTGNKNYSGNKPKKGPSLATIERSQATQIDKDLSGSVAIINSKSSLNDAQYSLNVANLGSDATEAQKLGLERKKLAQETALLTEKTDALQAAQVDLISLDPKTKEGLAAKKEGLSKVSAEIIKNSADIKKNSAAQQELANKTEQYNDAQKEQRANFLSDLHNMAGNQAYSQAQANIEQLKKSEQQLYEDGLISAKEYYGYLNAANELLFDTEKAHLEQQKADNLLAINSIKDREVEQGKLNALQLKGQEIDNALANNEKKRVFAKEDLTKQFADDTGGTLARNIKQQTQQALQQAITEAFTGDGVIPALKNFGKALENIIANSIGQVLSKRLTDALDSYFKKLGTSIQNLNGQQVAVSGSTVNGSSANFASGAKPAIQMTVGTVIAQYGASSTAKAQTTGGQLIGIGEGAVGGAIAGAPFGPIGMAVGAIAGGTYALTQAQRTTALGRNKDAIVGALLGGVTGAVIGHIMDNKANKLADWQRNSDKNQTLANAVLNSADQNNLDDLNKQIKYLQGLWSKQQKAHKGGKQPLKDAIAQLQQLVKQRQAVIDQEVASLKDEASGLQNQVDTFGKSDVEAAAENYKYNLQQLQSDTQKLLDQFKDSEEAKTQILANESLKRQLIEKQTQDTYKQSLQDLNDLFKQRDEISNQDVFTRAQTTSQKKAQDLASIDQQIAQALSSVSDLSQLGFAVPDVSGATQLLSAAQQASQQNNTLTFLINGAQDPNAIAAAINQQITAFFKKNFGATT